MFGSAILDVAIGMIFIYLLVAIMCTAIREGLAAWLKTRAAYLEHGLAKLLHDPTRAGLAGRFFHHPLIAGLYLGDYEISPKRKDGDGKVKQPHPFTSGEGLPSYIPPRSFALALLDLAARGPTTDEEGDGHGASALTVADVRREISRLQNPAVERAVLAVLDAAHDDLDKAVAGLEAWYDGAMERIGGWYKRSTQWVLLAIGLLVAIAFNVNSIVIVDHLYRDDALRDALVARAQAAAADTTPSDTTFAEARRDLESLSLPIGWDHGLGTTSERPDSWGGMLWYWFLNPVLGWLLTAFAAMLGAPFWFDLLGKFMVVRSTVKPESRGGEPEGGSGGGGSGGVVPGALGAVALLPPSMVSPGVPEVLRSTVPDSEHDVDGCDVPIDRDTPDEDLPASRGGVE